MPDEAENAAYALAEELQRIFTFPHDTGMQAVFKEMGQAQEVSGDRYAINLIKMFDEVLEVIAHLSLPENRISASRLVMISTQEAVMSYSRNTQEFATKVGLTTPMLLRTIGDTIVAANIDKSLPLDRDKFSESTSELIKTVQATPMPDIAKKALLLKLNAIRRIVHEAGIYSDDDIRRRVKAVVADFNAEFSIADAAHDSIRDKLWKWAKAVSKPGIFALALTADASAVVALLPPPQ